MAVHSQQRESTARTSCRYSAGLLFHTTLLTWNVIPVWLSHQSLLGDYIPGPNGIRQMISGEIVLNILRRMNDMAVTNSGSQLTKALFHLYIYMNGSYKLRFAESLTQQGTTTNRATTRSKRWVLLSVNVQSSGNQCCVQAFNQG